MCQPDHAPPPVRRRAKQTQSTPPVSLSQLWAHLPVEHRRRLSELMARIITRHRLPLQQKAMPDPEHALRPIGGVTPNLHDYHLRRLAIVYVRQSHPQQVGEHVESTARQYALVDRAIALGWTRDRVVVMDEDQGQSGQSMVTRLGFQRMLAEVSLAPVGLILGLEMSRLARSNTDWHQTARTLCACSDPVGRYRWSL